MESCTIFFFTIAITFLTACVQGQDTSNEALPIIKTHPHEYYYIVKKKPVTITCEAYDAVRITFHCSGKNIDANKDKVFDQFDPDSGKIVMKASIEVTRADIQKHSGEKDYWCECFAWKYTVDGEEEDGEPQYARSRRGMVALAYLKKKFAEEPSSQTAEIGSKVEFKCSSPDAKPKPDVIWRKENHRISPDKNSNYIVDEQGTLIIQSVRIEDEGEYSCIVRNPAGRRHSSSAQLTVVEKSQTEKSETANSQEEKSASDSPAEPGAEFLEKPDKNYYVIQGRPITIPCTVKGAEILEFRCNGQRLKDEELRKQVTGSRQDKVIRASYDVNSYDVERVERERGRDFSCHCMAWSILDGSWKSSESVRSIVKVSSIGDTFAEEPQSQTVAVGATAKFQCRPPDGKPEPKIFWMRNNEKIDLTRFSNMEISDDGLLTIHQVSEKDRAEFTCVAGNSAGTLTSETAELIISDQMEETGSTSAPVTSSTTLAPGTPVYEEDLEENQYIVNNQPVIISCKVRGSEYLFVTCNGQRLQDEDLLESYEETDDVTRVKTLQKAVRITKKKIVNFGKDKKYWCQCSAWFVPPGSAHWSHRNSKKSNISIATFKKRFALEPLDTAVEVGDDAEFKCQPPEGFPAPTVYWSKDGIRIDTTDPDSNKIMTDGKNLVIQATQLSDAGSYACEAENPVGLRVSNSAVLTVEGTTVVAEGTDKTEVDQEETTPSPTSEPEPEPESTPEAETEPEPTVIAAESEDPVFLVKPEPVYYIAKDTPAIITCRVQSAEHLTFDCNGQRVPEGLDDTRITIDHATKIKTLERSIEVTKKDLTDGAEEGEDYKCSCVAWYAPVGAQNWVQIKQETVVKLASEPDEMAATTGIPDTSPETTTYDPEAPYFIKQPKPVSYIVNDEAAVINCRTLSAEHLTFECNGKEIDVATENTYKTVEPETGGVLLEKSIYVTRADLVENTDEGDEYKCACIAWYIPADKRDWVKIRKETTVKIASKEATTSPEPEPETETDSNIIIPEPTDSDIIYSDTPTFLTGPKPLYYIHGDQPVTITCRTLGADQLIFECNEEQVPEGVDDTYMTTDPETGRKVLERAITVGKFDIMNLDDEEEYKCSCIASYLPPGAVERREIMKETLVKLASKMESTSAATIETESQPQPESETTDSETIDTADGMTTDSGVIMTTDAGVIMTTDAEVITIDSDGVDFVKEPLAFYYIVKNKPATISCRTHGAEQLTFECNGKEVPEGTDDIYETTDPDSGKKVLERAISVSRSDLMKRKGKSYKCVCIAWYREGASDWKKIRKPTTIEVAYLKKRFMVEPISQTVELDVATELQCKPPKANPKPVISWYKDGDMLDVDSDSNLMISESGSLSIKKMRMKDAGSYSCVADNDAGSRSTPPVRLDVYQTSVSEPEPEPESGKKEDKEGDVSKATDGPPVFVSHPEERIFVSVDKVGTLKCRAAKTTKITFLCNGDEMEEDKITLQSYLDDQTGKESLEATLTLQHDDVGGSQDLSCECHAWYIMQGSDDPDFVSSRKGMVEIAYLKGNFADKEVQKTTEVGKMVTLRCSRSQMQGYPRPSIYWTKDDVAVTSLMDNNLATPGDGSLIILSADTKDEGSYACVAENEAGKQFLAHYSLTIEGESMPASTAEPEGMPEIYDENTTASSVENDTMIIDGFSTESMMESENTTAMVETGVASTSEPEPESSTESYPEPEVTYEPGAEPESTPEAEAGGTTMAKCMQLFETCNNMLGNSGQGDQPSTDCLVRDNYTSCTNRFLSECNNKMRPQLIAVVILTRDKFSESCSPSKDCRKLRMCRQEFNSVLQQQPKNFNLITSCTALQTFLSCAGDAIKICNLERKEGSETTLADISLWFSEYCKRVPMTEKSFMKCKAHKECKLPLDSSTPQENLIDVNFWCSYIHSSVSCLGKVMTTCKVNKKPKLETDAHYLETRAQNYCPGEMVDKEEGIQIGGGEKESQSRNGKENSAPSTTFSILLATFVQLMAMFVIAYR